MTDREAFEAWAGDAGYGKGESTTDFDYPLGRVLWKAWQAATAAERDAPEVEELKAQRDELLTSLKELLSELEYGHACPLTKEKSRAAIAKAEGRTE